MMNHYKIIVLDLDGTLTNSEKKISPRTKEVLMNIQNQGVRLVLASGRPTYGIAPLADELKMNEHGGFVLAFNGGEIINWQTGQHLHSQLLPNDVIPTIYEASAQGNHAILTYDGEEIVTENPDDEYVMHEAFINKMPVRRLEHFLTDIPHSIPKCLIVGNPDELVKTEKSLAEKTQGQLSVYRSAPFFLEVVPPGIDKAASLNILLSHLGLEAKSLIAIGDGYNDLSMIEYAGMGVAMANAEEAIKDKADYVTTHDNDHDGVAEVIEKFFSL